MEIQVINHSEKTYDNIGRYVYAELVAGKHAAQVVISDRDIRVIVQNAAHKCWRGMGKSFRTADEAVANYKTPAVKEMIRAAVALAA